MANGRRYESDEPNLEDCLGCCGCWMLCGLIPYIIVALVFFSEGCGSNITYGGGCDRYDRIYNAIVTQNVCSSDIRNCLKVAYEDSYTGDYIEVRANNKVEEYTYLCEDKESYECRNAMTARYPFNETLKIFRRNDGPDDYYTEDYVEYKGRVGFVLTAIPVGIILAIIFVIVRQVVLVALIVHRLKLILLLKHLS